MVNGLWDIRKANSLKDLQDIADLQNRLIGPRRLPYKALIQAFSDSACTVMIARHAFRSGADGFLIQAERRRSPHPELPQTGKHFNIEAMAVSERAARLGLGTALAREATRTIQRRNLRGEIFQSLNIQVGDKPAIALAEKLGFSYVGLSGRYEGLKKGEGRCDIMAYARTLQDSRDRRFYSSLPEFRAQDNAGPRPAFGAPERAVIAVLTWVSPSRPAQALPR